MSDEKGGPCPGQRTQQQKQKRMNPDFAAGHRWSRERSTPYGHRVTTQRTAANHITTHAAPPGILPAGRACKNAVRSRTASANNGVTGWRNDCHDAIIPHLDTIIPHHCMTTPQPPFEGDYFTDATFTDLDLSAADLTDKEFDNCTFRRCKLPESRWTRCVLEDSVFEDCDLSHMLPQQLALRGVTFRNTRLVGVAWKGIERGPDVAFEGCDLRYASFISLRLGAVRVVNCTLNGANFLEVDLAGADFSGSDLAGSTIQGCTLTTTHFSRARGVFVDPATNVVKGARIDLEAALLLAESFGMIVETSEEREEK